MTASDVSTRERLLDAAMGLFLTARGKVGQTNSGKIVGRPERVANRHRAW
jgi:hypothetical protein